MSSRLVVPSPDAHSRHTGADHKADPEPVDDADGSWAAHNPARPRRHERVPERTAEAAIPPSSVLSPARRKTDLVVLRRPTGRDPREHTFHILIGRRLQPSIGSARSVVLANHFRDGLGIDLLCQPEKPVRFLNMPENLLMEPSLSQAARLCSLAEMIVSALRHAALLSCNTSYRHAERPGRKLG